MTHEGRKRMTWRPLHSQHAIERVRLIVQFSEQVPAKVNRKMLDSISALGHQIRMVGPTPVQAIGFSMVQAEGGMVPQPQTVTNGWQFTRNASNKAPLEAVVFDGLNLTYETADYQKWDFFKRRTNTILEKVLQIACESVDFQSISMEYINRFLFDGDATDANVLDLLTDASPMLHADAVSGKHLWHLHRGWFEDCSGGKALINQNFDAQEGKAAGEGVPKRSLQVLTKAELRADSNNLNIDKYEENLETLHNLTKYYFKAAIVQTHHEFLGLK